jgi:hypothetical protein
MSGAPKVMLLVLTVAAYFAVGVFGPWYDHLAFQAAILALLAALRLRSGGWAGLRADVRFLIPFVGMLVLMGLILDALGTGGRSDWTLDSLRKALVFPNSFWSVQLAAAAVRLRDLVALPLPKRWQRLLIISHALFHKSRPTLERLWWLTSHDPHLTQGGWVHRHGQRLVVLLVAALAAMYQQTETTMRVYDARMAFLEEEDP